MNIFLSILLLVSIVGLAISCFKVKNAVLSTILNLLYFIGGIVLMVLLNSVLPLFNNAVVSTVVSPFILMACIGIPAWVLLSGDEAGEVIGTFTRDSGGGFDMPGIDEHPELYD